MAEGGGSWSDEEEGDDIDELMFLPFLAPYLAEFKREGDARFRAKDYQEAATCYLMALTCPIPQRFDVSVISEQLFRRRAECLFKLGKYFEAIDACERAIEIADCTNNRKLVKSIFIKMKAIQCLGDYVPALPLAVWCKHLRPQCEKIKAALNELKDKLRNKFSKDDTLINQVLFNTIGFARKMEEDRGTLELALECYTELLDLLHFMFLPGVLLRRAGCLFHLGRLNEAKEDCEKALWRLPDNPEALALMNQITQVLKATRETNTKEKEKPKKLAEQIAQVQTAHLTSEDEKEPPTLFEEKQIGVEKPNVDLAKAQTTSEDLTASPTLFEVRPQATMSAEEKNEVQSQVTLLEEDIEEINPNDDIELILIPGDEKQDVKQDISASASAAEKVPNEGGETRQLQEVARKDDERKEKKKKRNKQKKRKKKENKKKKETQAKNDSVSEQKLTGNAPSPDVSDDESESQETESIIGETDVSLGYSNSTNTERNRSSATLSSAFKSSIFSDDEDSLFDDFIKVKNSRRSHSQTARPTATNKALDTCTQSHSKNKLPNIAAKTPHQPTAVTSQSSSRQNTPLQQMHSLDTPEIPGNRRSSFCDTKKIPAAEKGFSETSAESSVNTFSDACGHSKQPGESNVVGIRSSAPSTSQKFQREESIRQAVTEQHKASFQGSVFQEMQGQVSSHNPSSPHSSSTGHEASEISYTPVKLSQTFQSNVAARKLEFNDPRKIPDGVTVVCNHFLQQHCTQTSSTTIKSKVCTVCANCGFLRYAVWNNVKYYWQAIRPYPASKVPPKATLVVCRHFSANIPCPKDPCTFAHGKVEAKMWTMERQGFLPSPQESFSGALSGLSSITPFQVQCTRPGSSGVETSPSISFSNFDEFPSLGAVSSPNLASNIPRNAPYSAWNTPIAMKTPRVSLPSALLSLKTAVMDLHNSHAEGALSPQRFTAGTATDATPSASSVSPVVPPQSNCTRFRPPEISPSNSLKNAAPSVWNTHFKTPGRLTASPLVNAPSPEFSQIRRSSSLSSLQTTVTQSSVSGSDSRKVPPTVFVVCDDFLQKNRKRPASINEKIKACKGCENRSRLSYAIWNSSSKEWQKIRPYPTEVAAKVAFKTCKQYDITKQCLKTSCSFAHGEEELLMWTLEREGVLATPRETLTGSAGKAIAQISLSTQSSARLQYRPCPPGVTNGAYKLCRSCYTHERCRFGRGCIFAHSLEEITEWEEEYSRKEREKRVKEIQDRDEILSMEMVSEILKEPVENLVECLPGVDITCNPPELSIKLQDKNNAHTYQWTFNLLFKTNEVGCLRHVLLLHRYHNCYQLSEISVGSYQENRGCETYRLCYTAKLKDLWYKAPEFNLSGRVKVSLTVSFSSSLYGSFDQCVVFDFGKKPYLVQKLNADVHSDSLSQSPIVSEHAAVPTIWEEGSVEVVRFVHGTGEALKGEHLSRTYSLRKEVNIAAEALSRNNYKQIMHQLLFVEEGFMKDEISRYTLSNTQLHAQWNIFDEMTGMRCALDNELFGVLSLQEEDALRPDDAAGRLLYRNVSSVWVQLAESVSNKVYEAPVEKVESECVVLRLSSKMCSDLNLYDTCDVTANAQFQLNRWPLCEMHAAVDRLTTGQLQRLVFPDPTVAVAARSEVKIRWQWLLDQRLNDNQKTVIKRIASPEYNAPPLVVFGPFGTGKTFTLNQAVRLLVQVDKSHRVLLCTHSNRAADIHVELLHKYLTEQNGIPASRPLRVYQPMRRLETASEIARKYCLIKNGVFRLPSRDDLVEHRVVITTLSTSKVLLDLQVFHGFFTHILIDEAAQALEPEALTPLIFAGPNTKVVFTGDHMQMSPEVYSPNARQQGLQKSLAERLFDLYDRDKPEGLNQSANVMFLTENYRCNKEILQFPSDNFYGEKLIARGHVTQAPHPKYSPLLFFSARGKEQKEHDNSYINLPEVCEVVKRVKEIANSWPTSVWGPKKLSEIAVLSSYRYQVQAIRNSLRKDRDLVEVKVDTIHNVQGEEFRVLFISTVRTFHTCKPQQEQVRASGADRQLYWEFLSDPKLLNTAVTRARCLVAVVGDPVSLCTVGECRSIWKDYIKRCYNNGGLYGTTIDELEKEINAAIASIQLNPEAKPFVPNDGSGHEPTVSNHQSGENGVFLDENAADETRDEEPHEEKSDEVRSNVPQEASKKAIEKDEQDLLNASCASHVALYKDQQQKLKENKDDDEEAEDDEGNEETEDFQDDLLEDETVSPRYMDEIILAFVKKCEETSQLDAYRSSMFEDSEFPPLEASGSRAIQVQSARREEHSLFNEAGSIKDLFPEIRVVNGRVEVRLTNLGLYKAPSERAQRIIASTKQQEFLDPSVLRQLLQDEPQKYLLCNLRLSPEKSQVGYAQIEDTETPDIQIKGKVRQAFDKDKVVIELVEKKVRSKGDGSEPQVQGKVVGVLEHIISPHERQFVCTPDYENPAIMIPINKSATKLVNLTDKSCKDIPVYKKDQTGRATKVKMMKRETVLSGKYLFVVKYLQWRRDFTNPLGIVVRTMNRGEDLKSSMEIAFAEHGIRRAFRQETLKYVKEKFPPEWCIPQNEYSDRTRVDKAFTIDPPTSLDLDDALTLEETSSSTFLIGIHIADVSFFVTPNSSLDQDAFLRCTSYYPGEDHENVPMLPRELSEGHCSLLPDKDRLAVSVFVTLDNEGRMTEGPSVKRTIVRSCSRLSYDTAQMIIKEGDVSTTEIPVEIRKNIRQLSFLAQNRRRYRLGDGAFDHWQNEGIGDSTEAHELVEEMMIMANEEVAKLLSAKCPEMAPLRVQLPPKDHKLSEWIAMHGKYARLSLQLARIFQKSLNTPSAVGLLHSEKTRFKIQRWVWSAICQAIKSRDISRVSQLICNERNHPQIAAAQSQFRRIQSESRFVCEGDQPSENIQHYSLGIRSYTQFTSPIRRYMDITVHRLLLGLQSGSRHEENMSKDDITKICRRSTFLQGNARKFDKDCKRIHTATKLQQRCHETRVFIESIDHHSISLHICKPEDDHLAGRQKRLLLSHLNPVALTEEEEDEDEPNSVVLKWRFRKYLAPDAHTDLRGEDNVTEASYGSIGEVLEIPSDVWLRILDAIRSNDEDKLTTMIKETEAQFNFTCTSQKGKELSQPKLHDHARGEHYKHPHHNDKAPPSSGATVDHFYEKSHRLKRYDFFSVQLCPHMVRGILEPDIQLFKVNAHLNICIEHRRYPRESFAHTARHQASRERYGSIDEYITAWKPVLAMEAATEAVKENDGFIIEQLKVVWKEEDGNVSGLVSLPSSYCSSRQLDFYPGDLVCVRVPYPNMDSQSSIEKSHQENISQDYAGAERFLSDVWVGHCIIKDVICPKGMKKKAEDVEMKTNKVKIQMYLHQASSSVPEGLKGSSSHKNTVELIHRTLPQRRMYDALCNRLKDSSGLVHAICKGEEPKNGNFCFDFPTNLSLVQHRFRQLNQYQEAAVREALTKPFTLIQGPPGTGKTITGVHIAYWFTEGNKRLESYKVREDDIGETEVEGAYKAPPQVIYCGPSNKSVDVVTEYLMKIPSLKILRVYSDQIEQKEFPIPNKLKPARITRSDDELKICNEKLRSVSLHHVIRSAACPYEQELRQYEEGFVEDKRKGEEISQKDVDDYCKLIGHAERWALEGSGVQIILCTCATSGSPRITTSCDNIQQCVVDECGMCMEPESLVPITCSGARQVVLIGDHKQLQPVIQDNVAKALGLSVSMFERHSKRARMLRLQYRMHHGICEFPSNQFYDGKLETAKAVKSRSSSPVTFWPAMVRRNENRPIVFCHVEGQEESSAIATSESNEQSKSNMKEVRKVVQVAKYLVNRHRPQVRMSDVVILSPYREQRSKISELLKGAYDEIQVTTVTKSQGSEWDYVIISLVRSLKKDEIDPEPTQSWLRERLGFLTDEHQMNVGLTRARRGLCIIGNKYLLGMDEMWGKLLQHYEENHCLVDESWPWQ